MEKHHDTWESRVESLLELIADELQLVLLRIAKNDADEDQDMVEQHGLELTSRVLKARQSLGLY